MQIKGVHSYLPFDKPWIASSAAIFQVNKRYEWEPFAKFPERNLVVSLTNRFKHTDLNSFSKRHLYGDNVNLMLLPRSFFLSINLKYN